MDIKCKRCQSSIPASDINLETSIAKCTSCDAVFDFRDQISGGQAFARKAIEAPQGIELQTSMDGIEIIRRWFSAKIIGLLVFCVIWDVFMVVWFGIAVSKDQWSMVAFGTIHGVVGLGLTYYVVCGFVNRTRLRISFRDISVKHMPMPWFGGKVVPVGDIQQVFTKRKVHRNKNSVSYTYELHYLDQNDKENKLLPGLDKPEQALYIEQEIEKTLGIEDKAVSAEIARD